MKASALLACCAIIAAFALLAACSPDTSSETASCMDCHSGDTTNGNAVLAAQGQYENSGHFKGPRTYDPNSSSTGHLYVFHGSNAMYTNGYSGTNPNDPNSYCSQCHSHQGFVEFVTTGLPAVVPAASQPTCFTCHEPHINGNFTLRKQTAESLKDLTSFNYGQGNLCVTCHKARDTASSFLTPKTFPYAWRSSDGPHHGPQADFLLGTGNWVYGIYTYQGDVANPHTSSIDLPDACVSCHMYQPSNRLGGTLELGGHGMYLKGDVHGTDTDLVVTCKSCHPAGAPWPSSSAKFTDNGHLAAANWDGKNGTQDKLLEIQGLSDTLVTYFSTDTNFNSGAGPAPIEPIAGGSMPGKWNRDWEFVGATLTLVQSQSFFNFKLFTEDHSGGIHNPTFAGQILWDAIDNLNTNAAAGLTIGTRP